MARSECRLSHRAYATMFAPPFPAEHQYGFRGAEDNPEGLSIMHLEFRRVSRSGIQRMALARTSIPT